MPRETIASFEITYQEVLSADGTVDESLVPGELAEEDLRDLYRQMKRARRLDERTIALQRRGELGTYAPSTGQEAAQVGTAMAMAEDDWFVPSFREQAAAIALGVDPSQVLVYAMGLEEGAEIPEGTNALPPAIPVGSQALHAGGVGWVEALRDGDRAVMAYFGDGATSEGDVYEATNFAGVYDARTVFCCQNNQYAISTPRRLQTAAETLAQKAVAAGIESIQIDGGCTPPRTTRPTIEPATRKRSGWRGTRSFATRRSSGSGGFSTTRPSMPSTWRSKPNWTRRSRKPNASPKRRIRPTCSATPTRSYPNPSVDSTRR